MDYALMQVADETQNITRLEKYNLNGQFISLVKRNARPFSEVELFSPIDLEQVSIIQVFASSRSSMLKLLWLKKILLKLQKE